MKFRGVLAWVVAMNKIININLKEKGSKKADHNS